MSKQSLYLITGNAKKLEQFKQILGDQFDFQNQNIDLPQIQGDPEEVAKEKVKIAYQKAKKPVITQDTSLCFNAYKGLPGPYIKWFLKAVGVQGLTKMVQPFQDKTGYAMCILAYMGPELKQPILFIGKTPGKIVEPRGSRDFGWDPNFQPQGYDKTYAELPKQIKNTISHRFRAINEMKNYFARTKSQNKEQQNQKKDEKIQSPQKSQQKPAESKPAQSQKQTKKQPKSVKKQEKPNKKQQKKQDLPAKRQTRSRKPSKQLEQVAPKPIKKVKK